MNKGRVVCWSAVGMVAAAWLLWGWWSGLEPDHLKARRLAEKYMYQKAPLGTKFDSRRFTIEDSIGPRVKCDFYYKLPGEAEYRLRRVYVRWTGWGCQVGESYY